LLREDPRNQEALFARAQLNFTRGETVTAARDLRASLEVAQVHQQTIALIGDILLDTGDVAHARTALERAWQLDPTHMAPRLGLVRLAGLQGDFERGRALLGEPPSDPFDYGVYWVVRARFAMWARDREEARVVRDVFVAHAPPGFLRQVCATTTAVVLGLPLDQDPVTMARGGLDPRAGQRIAAFHLQFRAEVQAANGNVEGALAAMAGADGHGSFDALWVDRCPPLDLIRGHRDFQEMRERIIARAERVRAALGDIRL
jgi:hypothetical protein